MVTASDYEDVLNVTSENVEAFADQILTSLKVTGVAEKLADGVKPIQIGSAAGITYRRRGKVEGQVIDLVFVETVVAGRKYVFRLRTIRGTLSDREPYLWTVVAAAKFVEPESSEPEPQPLDVPEPQPLDDLDPELLGDPEDDPFG